MKKLFFMAGISLAINTTASAQSEFLPRVTEKGHSINHYDSEGKKHGYWEAYVNEHLKLVKKKEQAAFIVMVYYHHGKNLWEDHYFDHSKKFRLTEPLPKFEYGKPKFLNGHFSFTTKRPLYYRWLRYDFNKAYPELILSEYDVYIKSDNQSSSSDEIHKKLSWDFSKQFRGEEGSYQYISYADDAIEYASWFRKNIYSMSWYSTCGLCSDFTDSTLTLNGKTWSSANLKVFKFRNGDDIFYAETIEDFERCLEENIPACSNFKGQLVYNWHAINDPRGLAPEGWRLANDQDFKELRQFLGVNHVDFLRSAYSEDKGAKLGSNISGFDASKKGYEAPWWSVNNDNSETAHAWVITDEALTYTIEPQDAFYAVRLIKE